MKKQIVCIIAVLLATLTAGAASRPGAPKQLMIDTTEQWHSTEDQSEGMEYKEGVATPVGKTAFYRSRMQTFPKKTEVDRIVFEQSPLWLNWQQVDRIGPVNRSDAPVFLAREPGDYWMFARYRPTESEQPFTSAGAQLDGFDIPLKTTPFANQYDAPGGLKESLGGYHAWQSKDMTRWVHHGPITEEFSRWVTTAEQADGKTYIYYDFPNDQDPHLYIDDNLTDGIPGKNMGMAFKDPSDGSDCAVIRDLDGNFHIIVEDWSPINAGKHSWDSPLAGHAVSPDGIGNFTILSPPVDERTTPTGKFAEYPHPHWHKEDPTNYPAKPASVDVPKNRIKKGDTRAFATYEIHEPEQDAYGDWAAISIGGRYYLFCDFHPAGKKGRDEMSVAWFTSPDINQQFTFCGHVGQGHPDPDIGFAEGKFYLITQTDSDYVSPGPWVETVEARVGVDITGTGEADVWTDWQEVKERYEPIVGFSKQIKRIPASLDLSGLPAGFGFCFEFRVTDTTENSSAPAMDKVTLFFQ